MPQYMLSVHHSADEDLTAISESDMQRMFGQVDAFNQQLQSSGAWVFAGGLMPISDATTVDGTGPEPVVTDGPFAESKEYLGGFWVIEAPDLDTAHRIALEASEACGDKVEVRPFQAE